MSWGLKTLAFLRKAVECERCSDATTQLAKLRVELATLSGKWSAALAEVANKQATIGRLETSIRTQNKVLQAEMDRVRQLQPFEDLAILRLGTIDEERHKAAGLAAENVVLADKLRTAEASLSGAREDNRVLRVENGVLKEENTVLRLGGQVKP